MRHGIAAVGRRRARERLELDLFALAQVQVDEALHFGRGRGGFERGPGGGAADPLEPGLHLVDVGPQHADRLIGFILARDDIERSGERLALGGQFGIHGQGSFRWA